MAYFSQHHFLNRPFCPCWLIDVTFPCKRASDLGLDFLFYCLLPILMPYVPFTCKNGNPVSTYNLLGMISPRYNGHAAKPNRLKKILLFLNSDYHFLLNATPLLINKNHDYNNTFYLLGSYCARHGYSIILGHSCQVCYTIVWYCKDYPILQVTLKLTHRQLDYFAKGPSLI